MKNNKLTELITSLGDYDDLTFNLVCSSAKNTLAEIEKSIGESINVYFSEVFMIEEGLYFYALDTSYQSNKLIASLIAEKIQPVDEDVKVASFRHNCLGDPAVTMSWCWKLLEEVKENTESGFLINDFQDRDNWQGYDKYKD